MSYRSIPLKIIQMRETVMEGTIEILRARIVELETLLKLKDRQLAVIWDVLGRNQRLFTMANEALARYSRHG